MTASVWNGLVCPARDRRRISVLLAVGLSAACLLVACGDGSSGDVADHGEATSDVSDGPTGDRTGDADGVTDDPDASDGAGSSGNDDVSDRAEGGTATDGLDSDADSDVGEGSDGLDGGDTDDSGDTDASGDTDGGPDAWVWADYLPCTSDVDCPVGFGECVRELIWHHPDGSGTSGVSIQELDPERDQPGICTLACTSGASTCDQLGRWGGLTSGAEWTCQLLDAGESPYTTDVNDPQGGVSLDAMAQGRAFVAICRPPFGGTSAWPSSFCEACDEDSACGEGVCFDPLAREAGGGVGAFCLAPCADDGACPYGFDCEHVAGGAAPVCRPWMDTCGECLDRDQDGFGTGLCDGGVAPTAYDCDDEDALIYFDPSDLDHPFPELCGPIDRNCDGLPDEDYLIGNTAVRAPLDASDPSGGTGTAHCTECGDVCGGTAPSATRDCLPDEGAPSGFVCTIVCDASTEEAGPFANCDGDEATGCETDFLAARQADDALRAQWTAGDPVPETALWYADCDGDGFGNPERVVVTCSDVGVPDEALPCDEAAPGAGWVRNNLDCDDADAERYPGNAETCNGKDSNCDGTVDTPALLAEQGAACSLGLPGACDDGLRTCRGEEGYVCERAPGTPEPSATPLCEGYDPACDAGEDRTTEELTALLGEPCDEELLLGECISSWTCSEAGLACTEEVGPTEDRPDLEFRDTSCDGIDGDLSLGIFVNPFAPTLGDGSPDQPFQRLADALDLSGTTGRDVYLGAGTHEIAGPLVLRDGVGIYGGYSAGSWQRQRSTSSSVIRVTGPAEDGWLIGATGEDLEAPTELQLLTLEVTAPGDGNSAAGIVCTRCPGLVLRSVSVQVAGGGAGQDGSGYPILSRNEDGLSGVQGGSGVGSQPGAPGTDAPQCRTESAALYIGPGAGGAGGNAATSVGGRSSPGQAGTGFAVLWRHTGPWSESGLRTRGIASNTANAGYPAGPTGPATPAADAPRAVLVGGLPAPVHGVDGQSGLSGAGGSGSSGTTVRSIAPGANISIGGSSGGSGGCGGRGGNAGWGGGHSIGLLLQQSGEVALEDVRISTGSGGVGGRGGLAEGGGAGGAGGPQRSGTGMTSPPGGAGAPGAGGAGGGGGGGGWSFAVLRDGESGIRFEGATSTLTPGSGGTGGDGGDGGEAGSAAENGSSAAAGVPGAAGPNGLSGIINDPAVWPDREVFCAGPASPALTACDGSVNPCTGVANEGCPESLVLGETRSRYAFGGTGGSPTTSDCPEGSVVVGLIGREGVPLHNLQVLCRSVDLEEDVDATPFTYSVRLDEGAMSMGEPVGGTGGTPFEVTCADQEVVVGLDIRHLDRIRDLAIRCAPLEMAGEAPGSHLIHHGEVTTSGWTTGSDGTRWTWDCNEGAALTGLEIHADARIHRITPLCTTVGLQMR